MTSETADNWLRKMQSSGDSATQSDGAQARTVKRVGTQSRGSMILEVAEKLRPWFMKLLEGVRDNNGMLVQPAKVRAIALNVAQSIVKEQEQKEANV